MSKHDPKITGRIAVSNHDAPSPASSRFDAEEFLPMAEDWEMSEADKVELLTALWSIMVSFVDLGFRVDRIEDVLPDLVKAHGADDADLLNSFSTQNEQQEEDGGERS